MSTLVLLLVILVIGWVLQYLEEHEDDLEMNRMVRADVRAKRKRGDIVKEMRTRGY